VNHVPPKTCTYSCVYCQLGRTDNMLCERRKFYDPESVIQQVEERLKSTVENVDYVTFVPDGEPTLDVNLGKEIEAVKQLGVKTAVICNSSLLWMEEVKQDLIGADWISLKVDATILDTWKNINRPHGRLDLTEIMAGIREFSKEYRGTLATETMLVKGLNDGEEVRVIAEFLRELDPDESYVSLPTRPPAERSVFPADEEAVNRAYQLFSRRLRRVEYLIGYEGNAFASTGDIEKDLLSITAVHPMREEAVKELLKRTGSGWKTVESLIEENKLIGLEYLGYKFYMRKISSRVKE
jgi:wyosine [tRNA(Phe)-imidazoG37] synthetase (radical SAM superfamily)